MSSFSTSKSKYVKVKIPKALLRANRELNLLNRKISGGYSQASKNLGECEPQEFDFLIDEACEQITIAKKLPAGANKSPDISPFNESFLDSFNPAFCRKYPPENERLIDPLWVAILEAAEHDLRFSLLCYRKTGSVDDIKPFSRLHRIANNPNTRHDLFSMTYYYTGHYGFTPESYKPFYISVDNHPTFIDKPKIKEANFPPNKDFCEGICLRNRFVGEVDKMIFSIRERLFGVNEYEEIRSLINEIGERVSNTINDRSRAMKSLIDIKEENLKFVLGDEFRLQFSQYIVWLRMMALYFDRKWMEYWYFPVSDLISNNLHGVTIALPEGQRMDEHYFHTLNGQLPKLFSHRAAIRFAQQKARETKLATELTLERDITHFAKNAMTGLARTQRIITEGILDYGSPKLVMCAQLQESVFDLISAYQGIRQAASTVLGISGRFKDVTSNPVRLDLEQFLRTVHMHALLARGYVSRSIAEIMDNDKAEKVLPALNDLYKSCRSLKTLTDPDSGEREDHSEENENTKIPFNVISIDHTLILYELIFPTHQEDFYSTDSGASYSLQISLKKCLYFYTALLEVFVNSVKHDYPNVYCKVLDYGKNYILFITTTNQNTPDPDFLDYESQKWRLTETISSEGKGLSIIKESLKQIDPSIEFKFSGQQEDGRYGFWSRPADQTIKYFWTVIIVPRNLGLVVD